ncbi:DNA methyltransferase [Paenibacillus elgii]|uniref:DNA methyltransferase n=1 Tax=Paenibacillus elgii TaxID=189691 RepID=A0A161S1U1_9BACL|nr:DNA cytosine methyltransferase [Paenibacillus elgii]KZE78224.1 DNA methyltransferase [Paenibacillus elgii]
MKRIFSAVHLFGGIGGGSLGFSGARGELLGKVGRFRTLCSIDVDPVANRNYERITGGRAVQMDLFSRSQYIKFHGYKPPDDWREVRGIDILEACGECPDAVFLSPPCKGFSGLLPEEAAQSPKYQALNELTVRSVKLTLEAFASDLPALILIENVPRIVTRGKKLLAEIEMLLKAAGYAINRESHCCGEIGGLGQRRKRFLLIARNIEKLGAFVYRPEKKRLKTIGEILDRLPLPGDIVAGGANHRLPKLEWKTWVKLALIPAGKDWRYLNTLDYSKYRISYHPRGAGAFGVQDWNEPAKSVIGNTKINGSNGAAAVADQRLHLRNGKANLYRVHRIDQPASCVTGAVGPSNGAVCISDPKLKERASRHPGVMHVVCSEEPSPCVTGTRFGSGALAVADPNLPTQLQAADLHMGCKPRSGTMGVQDWEDSSVTITGSMDVHAGAAAVADPRIPRDNEKGVFYIIAEDGTIHRPLTTFELAMIQSFPQRLPDGTPFEIVGCRDSKAREYIGNAVPPEAAKAIGEVMLVSLMASSIGYYDVSDTDIWVMPDIGTGYTEHELVH